MGGFLASDDRPAVLYVIQLTEVAGGERIAFELMRADRNPLLACPPESTVSRMAAVAGVPVVPLPFRPLRHSGGFLETLRSVARGLQCARDLRKLLRAHPDRQLVYAAQVRPGMFAVLAGLGLRRKVVWMVTNTRLPFGIQTVVRVLASVGCDLAIAISEISARDFAGRSRRLRRRTVVVHPGIDLERFHPERARPAVPRAALVGYVSPVKETALALDVFRQVARERPDFRLDIVGEALFRDSDAAYERRLRRVVAEDPPLREGVRFLGQREDVEEVLVGCGLLLHCCRVESFGLVLVEAMAAGLPIVAPAAGGPLEIVEEGVTGLLFPPGDAEAAAAHVLALLRDPERAAAMGAAGRARVEQRFARARQIAGVDTALAALVRDERTQAGSILPA